jgi:hypothetical protein
MCRHRIKLTAQNGTKIEREAKYLDVTENTLPIQVFHAARPPWREAMQGSLLHQGITLFFRGLSLLG